LDSGVVTADLEEIFGEFGMIKKANIVFTKSGSSKVCVWCVCVCARGGTWCAADEAANGAANREVLVGRG